MGTTPIGALFSFNPFRGTFPFPNSFSPSYELFLPHPRPLHFPCASAASVVLGLVPHTPVVSGIQGHRVRPAATPPTAWRSRGPHPAAEQTWTATWTVKRLVFWCQKKRTHKNVLWSEMVFFCVFFPNSPQTKKSFKSLGSWNTFERWCLLEGFLFFFNQAHSQCS